MRDLQDYELKNLVTNVSQIRSQLENELMRRLPFTQSDCDNLSIEELQNEVRKLASIQGGGA